MLLLEMKMLNRSDTQAPDVCVSDAEARRVAAEDNEVLAAAEACTEMGVGDGDGVAWLRRSQRVVAWMWRAALCCVAVAALTALLVVVTGVKAHYLPADVTYACKAEGGCKLVSQEALMLLMQRTYRAGQATCESKI